MNLYQIQADIEAREKELAQVGEDLKKIEIEEREKRAREESQEELKKATDDKSKLEKLLDKSEKDIERFKERIGGKEEEKTPEPIQKQQPLKYDDTQNFPFDEVIIDLNSILTIVKDTGCDVCAARIKVKALLTKYNELAA